MKNEIQFIEVTNKFEEIDTLDSYTESFYLLKEDFLMPLVNILLMGNVLENEPNDRIEFAYLLLKKVSKIDWIGENQLNKKIIGRKNISNKKSIFTDWFTYRTASEESYELKIDFDEIWLLIPKEARMSNIWFAPFDTPNFPKNINQKDLTDFYNLGKIKNNTGVVKEINEKFVFYHSEKEYKNIEYEWTKI